MTKKIGRLAPADFVEIVKCSGLGACSPNPLLVLLEVLDLLHRKVLGTRAGCGAIGRKRAAALGGVKKARATVAPEIPIQVDRVKTTRDISFGKVEAVSVSPVIARRVAAKHFF